MTTTTQTNRKTTITNILIDLDGVIVNFDAQFEKVIGVRPEFSNRDDHYKNFSQFVNSNGFLNAPVMPNAKTFFNGLVKHCYKAGIDLHFLGSDGSISEFRQQVMEQKRQWLIDNGFWLGESKFILSHGWRAKADYATPTTLLIDDTERNCRHFGQAGGHTILYNNMYHDKTLQNIIYNT